MSNICNVSHHYKVDDRGFVIGCSKPDIVDSNSIKTSFLEVGQGTSPSVVTNYNLNKLIFAQNYSEPIVYEDLKSVKSITKIPDMDRNIGVVDEKNRVYLCGSQKDGDDRICIKLMFQYLALDI